MSSLAVGCFWGLSFVVASFLFVFRPGVYAALSAQSQPSSQSLLRFSYLARGGDNWNNLAQADESGTLIVGGVSGTFHQTIDLKNGRDVIEFDVGLLQDRKSTRLNSSH